MAGMDRDRVTGLGPGRGPGEGDGEPDGLGPGITPPVPIYRGRPRYTVDAVRARVQGSILVECVVQPSGTCTHARVVRTFEPPFGLDREAILAAGEWRFRPGRRGSEQVPVRVTIEVAFANPMTRAPDAGAQSLSRSPARSLPVRASSTTSYWNRTKRCSSLSRMRSWSLCAPKPLRPVLGVERRPDAVALHAFRAELRHVGRARCPSSAAPACRSASASAASMRRERLGVEARRAGRADSARAPSAPRRSDR